MADEFGMSNAPVVRNDLFGRLDIYSPLEDINAENVMEELQSCVPDVPRCGQRRKQRI